MTLLQTVVINLVIYRTLISAKIQSVDDKRINTSCFSRGTVWYRNVGTTLERHAFGAADVIYSHIYSVAPGIWGVIVSHNPFPYNSVPLILIIHVPSIQNKRFLIFSGNKIKCLTFLPILTKKKKMIVWSTKYLFNFKNLPPHPLDIKW